MKTLGGTASGQCTLNAGPAERLPQSLDADGIVLAYAGLRVQSGSQYERNARHINGRRRQIHRIRGAIKTQVGRLADIDHCTGSLADRCLGGCPMLGRNMHRDRLINAMVRCRVRSLDLTLAAVGAACFLTAHLVEPHLGARSARLGIVSSWLGASLVAAYVWLQVAS